MVKNENDDGDDDEDESCCCKSSVSIMTSGDASTRCVPPVILLEFCQIENCRQIMSCNG